MLDNEYFEETCAVNQTSAMPMFSTTFNNGIFLRVAFRINESGHTWLLSDLDNAIVMTMSPLR